MGHKIVRTYKDESSNTRFFFGLSNDEIIRYSHLLDLQDVTTLEILSDNIQGTWEQVYIKDLTTNEEHYG